MIRFFDFVMWFGHLQLPLGGNNRLATANGDTGQPWLSDFTQAESKCFVSWVR